MGESRGPYNANAGKTLMVTHAPGPRLPGYAKGFVVASRRGGSKDENTDRILFGFQNVGICRP